MMSKDGCDNAVVYLVSQYPAATHTFIRREILALERLGYRVARVSVRRWQGQLADPVDRSEADRTTVILEAGWLSILTAICRCAIGQPRRFMHAVAATYRLWSVSDRSLALHFVYLAEACWLSRFISTSGASHLHAHFGTNPAAVAMMTHILAGIPYSFTVHGYDEFDKPEALGLKHKISLAKFVVAISSYGRSQLMRWADVEDWPKLVVVRCGIDEAFYDTPPSNTAQQNRIVSIGRLCKEKAQLLLVDAIAQLRADGVDVFLTLVGDGVLRPLIEQRIIDKGLSQNIKVTGWISSAGVQSELLSSIALVHPSFADGLPVSIMEAMALRRPVIACYVAGTPELVEDESTGWLVPASDLLQLTAALKACMTMDASDRMAMGQRGRERVLEFHQIDKESKKLALLFAKEA